MKNLRPKCFLTLFVIVVASSNIHAKTQNESDSDDPIHVTKPDANWLSVTTLLEKYREISKLEVELAHGQMQLQQYLLEQIQKLHGENYASWHELQNGKAELEKAKSRYRANIRWSRFIKTQLQLAQELPVMSIRSASRVVVGIDSCVPIAWVTSSCQIENSADESVEIRILDEERQKELGNRFSYSPSRMYYLACYEAIMHRLHTEETFLAELDKGIDAADGSISERAQLKMRIGVSRIEQRLCSAKMRLPELELDVQAYLQGSHAIPVEMAQGKATDSNSIQRFLQIMRDESNTKLQNLDHAEFGWLTDRTKVIAELADRGLMPAQYSRFAERRVAAIHQSHAESRIQTQEQFYWVEAKLDDGDSVAPEPGERPSAFETQYVLDGISIAKCENATAIAYALDWARSSITLESELDALAARSLFCAESLDRVRDQTSANPIEVKDIEHAEKSLVLQKMQLQSQLKTCCQLLKCWPVWSTEIAQTRLELLDRQLLRTLVRYHHHQLNNFDGQGQSKVEHLDKRLLAFERLRSDGLASDKEVADAKQILLNFRAEDLQNRQSLSSACETDDLIQLVFGN